MYDYRKLELDALPDATGGRSFEPGTLDEESLAKILREIGAEISNEIVVGYEPEGAADGQEAQGEGRAGRQVRRARSATASARSCGDGGAGGRPAFVTPPTP